VRRLARAELAAIDSSLLARLGSRDDRRTRLAATIVGDHLYLERAGASLDGAISRASLG
jgi:hypothetical protein